MEKAREFQKNIYFCFIDYSKAFDSVDHQSLQQSYYHMVPCMWVLKFILTLTCPGLRDFLMNSFHKYFFSALFLYLPELFIYIEIWLVIS